MKVEDMIKEASTLADKIKKLLEGIFNDIKKPQPVH